MKMAPTAFLAHILDEQTLKEGCHERLALLAEHDRVRALLLSGLTGARPTIEIGGSLAKGTLVRAGYDLDTLCYFDNDDDGAGATLEEIRESVESALKVEYRISPKCSAITLTARKNGSLPFSIDVVPGRYIDGIRQDVFLHQAEGDKDWLKTNLRKHISHIGQSGQVDMIRLAKIWKLRADLKIKTFVLELLVVEILKEVVNNDLETRLRTFWKVVRDDIDSIQIKDPANPTGNDLASVFGDDEKEALGAAATIALDLVEANDWEALFGELGTETEPADRAVVSSLALLALGDTSHVQEHSWPVHRGPHDASVTCRVSSRRGGTFGLASNGLPVTDEAKFRFEGVCNVPAPFEVRWQVANTGAHAAERGALRGNFIEAKTNPGDPTTGLVHRESAEYTGKHWVECFILKNGALWTRSGRFYVNIVSRKRRSTPWFWRRTR